ncbi:MAG: response regulator, partial [Elusimicrobia bacterium]|nr:response regulator [Elusimicrobiota bacterium]
FDASLAQAAFLFFSPILFIASEAQISAHASWNAFHPEAPLTSEEKGSRLQSWLDRLRAFAAQAVKTTFGRKVMPAATPVARFEIIHKVPMGDDVLARDVTVHLPPSYQRDPQRRYPVLYMHDGQNLFFASESAFGVPWEADQAVDALVASHQLPEIIVVGIHNTPRRMEEYTPDVDSDNRGGQGDQYVDAIVHHLKPFIDRRFRTIPDRANTAMMGSSLGGLISFHAMTRYPEVFGRIGCLSSSFWWNDRSAIKRFNESKPAPSDKQGRNLAASAPSDKQGRNLAASALPLRLWIDGGTAEGNMVANNRAVMGRAIELGGELGVTVSGFEDPLGQHNEASWARRLPYALAYLFKDMIDEQKEQMRRKHFEEGFRRGKTILQKAPAAAFVNLKKEADFLLRYHYGQRIIEHIQGPADRIFAKLFDALTRGEDVELEYSLRHHSSRDDFFIFADHILDSTEDPSRKWPPSVRAHIDSLRARNAQAEDMDEKVNVNVQLLGFMAGLLEQASTQKLTLPSTRRAAEFFLKRVLYPLRVSRSWVGAPLQSYRSWVDEYTGELGARAWTEIVFAPRWENLIFLLLPSRALVRMHARGPPSAFEKDRLYKEIMVGMGVRKVKEAVWRGEKAGLVLGTLLSAVSILFFDASLAHAAFLFFSPVLFLASSAQVTAHASWNILHPETPLTSEEKKPSISLDQVSVRSATEADIPAIIETHDAAWKGKRGLEELYDEETLREFLKQDPDGVRIAEHEGKILGVLFSRRLNTGGDLQTIGNWSWEHITGAHSQETWDSRIFFAVGVPPSTAVPGVGKRIINASKAYFEKKEPGTRYYCTLSPTNYGTKDFGDEYREMMTALRKEHPELTDREFDLQYGVRAHLDYKFTDKNGKEKYLDPTAQFHRANGAKVGAILPPLRPDAPYSIVYSYSDIAEKAPSQATESKRITRILLVDDDAEIRERYADFIRESLGREGIEVELVVAKNGEDGFRKYQENPGVDVLITDTAMPLLNGPGLIQRIRETRPQAKTVFLLMSGDPENGSIARSFGVEFHQKDLNRPIKLLNAFWRALPPEVRTRLKPAQKESAPAPPRQFSRDLLTHVLGEDYDDDSKRMLRNAGLYFKTLRRMEDMESFVQYAKAGDVQAAERLLLDRPGQFRRYQFEPRTAVYPGGLDLRIFELFPNLEEAHFINTMTFRVPFDENALLYRPGRPRHPIYTGTDALQKMARNYAKMAYGDYVHEYEFNLMLEGPLPGNRKQIGVEPFLLMDLERMGARQLQVTRVEHRPYPLYRITFVDWRGQKRSLFYHETDAERTAFHSSLQTLLHEKKADLYFQKAFTGGHKSIDGRKLDLSHLLAGLHRDALLVGDRLDYWPRGSVAVIAEPDLGGAHTVWGEIGYDSRLSVSRLRQTRDEVAEEARRRRHHEEFELRPSQRNPFIDELLPKSVEEGTAAFDLLHALFDGAFVRSVLTLDRLPNGVTLPEGYHVKRVALTPVPKGVRAVNGLESVRRQLMGDQADKMTGELDLLYGPDGLLLAIFPALEQGTLFLTEQGAEFVDL